jgi:hydrogenase maturation protein HypF
LKPKPVRRVLDLTGTVQGVGFRPAVYRLAREAALGGWVRNRTGSVRICLTGGAAAVEKFVRDMPRRLPPNAAIRAVAEVGDQPRRDEDYSEFAILDSDAGEEPDIAIPADLAICADCAREVLDPANRRYGYPFTTCTNCGPRYTVVAGMPYDRERTSLAAFPLCPDCLKEYSNPADRRFHAETTACGVCGPRLALHDSRGKPAPATSPLADIRRALAGGRIVAVRGIGGFLLACDAANREAVTALRLRKTRPHKPFAVMFRDLDVLRRICAVPPGAAALLSSPSAPIVILDLLPDPAPGFDAAGISPDTGTIGAMLPTSPLHLLLFEPLRGDPVPPFGALVMTSGNRGGEPICLTNGEAFERLGGIADLFLCHDREISLRNDDSICSMRLGSPQVWRLARGFAPAPVPLSPALSRCVLGMGAEIKNAVALGYGDKVVLSPHVGDLETPEACRSLEQMCELLPSFLRRRPRIVAVDLHPDMHATRLGRRIAARLDVPVRVVQHHHAHAAAVLAEHGETAGLCLAFDGTGLGPDGSVWGAELLALDGADVRRLATFVAAPLPGGDAAVRRPARQVVGRCRAAGIAVGPELRARLGTAEREEDAWKRQCEKSANAPLSHAAGRVFDAVSALLGTAPRETTYDGQAAMRLEAAARKYRGAEPEALPFEAREEDGLLVVDWSETFRALCARPPPAEDAPRRAAAFHHAVAAAAAEMVGYGFSVTSHRVVGLSGGVFMNGILNDLLARRLERMRAKVLIHRRTPPNDGCIAFGQVVAAGR